MTKNSKDFADPDIVLELAGLGCGLFSNFGEGYGFVLAKLPSPPQHSK